MSEKRWYEVTGNITLSLPVSKVTQEVRDGEGNVIHSKAKPKLYGFLHFFTGSKILLEDRDARRIPYIENITPIFKSQAWKLQFGALLEPQWGDHARFARRGDPQAAARLAELAKARGIKERQGWADEVLAEHSVVTAPILTGEGQITEADGHTYAAGIERERAVLAATAAAAAAPPPAKEPTATPDEHLGDVAAGGGGADLTVGLTVGAGGTEGGEGGDDGAGSAGTGGVGEAQRSGGRSGSRKRGNAGEGQ